jgi:hypothetical protein
MYMALGLRFLAKIRYTIGQRREIDAMQNTDLAPTKTPTRKRTRKIYLYRWVWANKILRELRGSEA